MKDKFKQIENHQLVDPCEPVIINVVRFYDFEESKHYYTIVALFILSESHEEAVSMTTDVKENTIVEALNTGLNGLQYLYKDINSSAIVYDGDLGKPLSTINLNEIYGENVNKKRVNGRFSEMVH